MTRRHSRRHRIRGHHPRQKRSARYRQGYPSLAPHVPKDDSEPLVGRGLQYRRHSACSWSARFERHLPRTGSCRYPHVRFDRHRRGERGYSQATGVVICASIETMNPVEEFQAAAKCRIKMLNIPSRKSRYSARSVSVGNGFKFLYGMKVFAPIVLIGFISMSLFGFIGMLDAAEMTHTPSRCIASLAQNGACPPPKDTLDSAIFHTNAMKAFTTTVLSAVFALVALVALFCISLTLLWPRIRAGRTTLCETVRSLTAHAGALFSLRLALVRFEHSPTAR